MCTSDLSQLLFRLNQADLSLQELKAASLESFKAASKQIKLQGIPGVLESLKAGIIESLKAAILEFMKAALKSSKLPESPRILKSLKDGVLQSLKAAYP